MDMHMVHIRESAYANEFKQAPDSKKFSICPY